jgi:hypothetical protein
MEHSKSALPPPFVWKNIEHTISPNTSRRKTLFFLLAFTAATAVGTYLWSTQHGDKTNANKIVENYSSIASNDANPTTEVATSINQSTKSTNTPTINTTINEFLQVKTSQKLKSSKNRPELSTPLLSIKENPKGKRETYKSDTTKGDEAKTQAISKLAISISARNKLFKFPPLQIKNNLKDISTIAPLQSATNVAPSNENQANKLKKARARSKTGYFVETGTLVGVFNKQFSPESYTTRLRQETEQEWYLWGVYIGAGLNFSSHFYGSAQLNWTQQKDRFSITRDSITKVIVEDKGDGTTQLSTKTGKWISEGEINYNTLNGVVLLGYKFLDQKKSKSFNFGVEGGLMYNMRLNTSGKIATSDKTVAQLKDEEIYKTNLGVGISAQLVTQFYLNDNLSITLKPYFSTYFDNWNVPAYNTQMKTHNFGTMLGVKREF